MKGFYILMGVALIRVFAKTEVGEKEARSCLAKRSEKYGFSKPMILLENYSSTGSLVIVLTKHSKDLVIG